MAFSLLASDDFNRADAANLGANWTVISTLGTLKVASNQCVVGNNNSNGNGDFYNAVTFPADQSSKVTVVSNSGTFDSTAALVRCASGAKSYYAGGCDTLNVNKRQRIWKMVSGTRTSLAATSTDIAGGDLIETQVVATALAFLVNGPQVLTTTDSDLASGQPGLWQGTTVIGTDIQDNWFGYVFLPAYVLNRRARGLRRVL